MSLKKCSIRDVAALAGVSISTVSRILNNHEKAKTIPPEVHKRVQECARQLEYVPNANARCSATGPGSSGCWFPPTGR